VNNREKRIGELIKEKISTLLREKVADPRIGFVSIIDVEVAPDLKSAKVFISIFGTEKAQKESMAGLLSAKGFIQGEVGRTLDLRYTPVLTFIADKTMERASRIMAIMNRLEKEAVESRKASNEKHLRPNKRSRNFK